MPTSVIDEQIIDLRNSVLYDFSRSPRGKLLQLIGRSCVEWNDRLDAICMRVAERAETDFTEQEESVLAELHERISIYRTKKEGRARSKHEIDAIVAFWWHLQEYRTAFLKRTGRADTANVILTKTEIQRVKRDWEDQECLPDLTPAQMNRQTSVYNAMLHNKSGWSTVANAVIEYKLPELPDMSEDDGIGQHIQSVDQFCRDLLTWSKQFAASAFYYWSTDEYSNARASAKN